MSDCFPARKMDVVEGCSETPAKLQAQDAREGRCGRESCLVPWHRLEQIEGSKSIGAFDVFQGGSLKKIPQNTLSVCHWEVKAIAFQVLAPESLCSCNIKKNVALNPKI